MRVVGRDGILRADWQSTHRAASGPRSWALRTRQRANAWRISGDVFKGELILNPRGNLG
jgi:hypothetical protein